MSRLTNRTPNLGPQVAAMAIPMSMALPNKNNNSISFTTETDAVNAPRSNTAQTQNASTKLVLPSPAKNVLVLLPVHRHGAPEGILVRLCHLRTIRVAGGRCPEAPHAATAKALAG